MTHKRMIYSDLLEDDFFTSLTIFNRLLWIGLLIGCADDQGRVQDNPAIIRSKIFPADNIPLEQIEEGLQMFFDAGKIGIRIVDYETVIQIVNWTKYVSTTND